MRGRRVRRMVAMCMMRFLELEVGIFNPEDRCEIAGDDLFARWISLNPNFR
jgi:hypothetical protein